MVATVNNLLQPQAQAAWKELSTAEQLRAATMLLDTVEQGAFVLADNLLKTDIVQENTDNIREWRPNPNHCQEESMSPCLDWVLILFSCSRLTFHISRLQQVRFKISLN